MCLIDFFLQPISTLSTIIDFLIPWVFLGLEDPFISASLSSFSSFKSFIYIFNLELSFCTAPKIDAPALCYFSYVSFAVWKWKSSNLGRYEDYSKSKLRFMMVLSQLLKLYSLKCFQGEFICGIIKF